MTKQKVIDECIVYIFPGGDNDRLVYENKVSISLIRAMFVFLNLSGLRISHMKILTTSELYEKISDEEHLWGREEEWRLSGQARSRRGIVF